MASSHLGHRRRRSGAQGRVQGYLWENVRSLHPVSHSPESPRNSLSSFFDKISNDLEWDGESKRIIAVGDGKEKCVNF
jgi:hypothetical protein